MGRAGEAGGAAATVAVITGCLLALFVLLPGILLTGFTASNLGSWVSGTGTGDTPPQAWREIVVQAATGCDVPAGLLPPLADTLLGIGDVESSFGRSTAPGVRSGHNSAGAEGPMQFLPATFTEYDHPVPAYPSPTPDTIGAGAGNGAPARVSSPNRAANTAPSPVAANATSPPPAPVPAPGPVPASQESPYDPVDAIYAAARMLCSDGYATGDVRQAVYSYNHSDSYVSEVLSLAMTYLAETSSRAVVPTTSAPKAQPGSARATRVRS